MLIITPANLYSQDTIQKKDNVLASKIDYEADSIWFDIKQQQIYLYGNAIVNYEDMEVKANEIVFNSKTNMIEASPLLDSAGKVSEPINFKNKNEQFTAERIEYNMKTQRGRTMTVKTQVGQDGYILGDTTKRQSTGHIHIKGGRYTTCDLDHPHYYFRMSRAVVRPDNKIISGPFNLYIAGIPTPLGLPFGFFPEKKERTAGVIFPQYGDSEQYGFFLQNLGYYLPINDHIDVQVLGDIYSNGNWALKNLTRYKTRYKYDGSIFFDYSVIKDGDREFGNFSRRSLFNFRWNHVQDRRARPNSNFTANVNISSINNAQQNLSVSDRDYLTNTFQSSISYAKTWDGKPYNLNAALRHEQNSQSGVVNFTLPDVSFNVNRIYPFKVLNNSGVSRWYDNIGLTYNSQLRNTLSVQDSVLNEGDISQLVGLMRNGVQHRVNLNTSFKLLNKNYSLNPSFSYTERWYTETIERNYDNSAQEVVTDTINGFSRNYDYSIGASLTTKLYGYYAFKGFLAGEKRSKIRHTLTPTVGFSYRPDFSTLETGYFGTNGTLASYSPYEGAIFGVSPAGESGNITFSLNNSLDMKYDGVIDTATNKPKKLTLIDNFSFSGSYNLFADSLNLSIINFNLRTQLFKKLNVTLNASLDPYHSVLGTRVNEYEINETGRLARITTSQLTLGYSLNSKAKTSYENILSKAEEGSLEYQNLMNNPEQYIDFNIPWNATIGYNLNYRKQFNSVSQKDTNIITQTLRLSGQLKLTPKWQIGFNTGFDFEANQVTYTSFNIYRDLHCWELVLNWIPLGFRQSYNIQINIKSSVLKDLKVSRRRAWFDN